MAHITLYTQDDCPPCSFIKNYLHEHQIPFEEKHIKASSLSCGNVRV